MHFRTTYHSLLFYKRIFCHFLQMPIYAVIFRASKSGSIADNWDVARGMRDASPNSFAKKFATVTEAKNYIKGFNFKIVQNAKSMNVVSGDKGVKRKKIKEDQNNSVISSVKEFSEKVNKAFNDLQVSLTCFPGLSGFCIKQLKDLNYEVIGKLNEILKVNETESNKDVPLSNTTNDHIVNGTLPTCESILLSDKVVDFHFNEKKEVIIYTDGACSNNGYKGASSGAGIWFGDSHPLNSSFKVPGVQTNNNAEIYSVIKAIETVKEIAGLTKVNIHTDSEFVIKCMNEWVPRWRTNGWKTSAGSEVKNKEMLMMLDHLIKSMDSVSWTHVTGHSGCHGNEEADKLARLGAKHGY